ncbi:very short patch repair endonuclease [Gordonia sinesedis]
MVDDLPTAESPAAIGAQPDDATHRDQVIRLVEFLRDLVRSRSVLVADVDGHPGVVWIGKGTAVPVRSSATRGPTVIDIASGDDGYDDIAAIVDEYTSRPETLELVLANALVTVCDTENEAEPLVREHLLTQEVVVDSDAADGSIRLRVADSAPRIDDTHLLAAVPGVDLAGAAAVRSTVADLPTVIHGRAARLADDWRAAIDVDDARVTVEVEMAPALVLRARTAAPALGFYDAILDQLRQADTGLPVGLAQLVSPIEAADRLAALEAGGATPPAELVADALYPLPSNVEQRDVLGQLGVDTGVVVEGPPGTGKTQTIANVVAALLARGQRVLVTSEKANALRVLRDILPPELRELTISLADVGQDRSDAIVAGVEAMAERKSTFSARVADAEIADLESRLAQAVDRRERALRGLWELRKSETDVHEWVAGDYRGTAAEVVRRCNADADRYDWLPGPLDGPIPPLDAREFARLLDLLRTADPDGARLRQRLPEPDSLLPAAADLDRVCERIARRPAEPMVGSGSLMSILADVDSGRLIRIKQLCDRLGAAAADVRSYPPMIVDLADRLLAGQGSHLWSRVTALSPVIAEAAHRDRGIGAHAVVVDGARPGDSAIFAAAAAHLRSGGRWRGRLRRSEPQRAVEESGITATVDGRPATTAQSLAVVADHLAVTDAVYQVQRALADLRVPLDMSGSRSAQLDQLVRLDHQLARVSELLDARDRLVHEIESISPGGPRPRTLAEAVDVAREAGAIAAANDALLAEAELADRMRAVSAEVERGPSPEGDALVAALTSADAEAIRKARRDVVTARGQQDDQNALDLLALRLRSKAPEFATLLTETAQDPAWDARMRDVGAAWAWRRARTWAAQRSDPGGDARLQATIDEADVDVAQLTTALAAARAWRACLGRVSVAQVQALQSYRDHMINVGKGAGKHADRFRSAAREAMEHAAGAVPAWIMSLGQVADILPAQQDSFDVVVVDEASQADITSSFLLWLAPRVIVVGDDKQCAPTGLSGTTLDDAFAKLDLHLPDLPHYLRDGLTPRSSLFSLLRSRFGHLIRLREHFRSMPEIIEYSSRQFYAGSPLVPVRQFGADRLDPIRTVVVDGIATGQGAGLVNEVEAAAIVETLVDCLGDPRYDGMDFGVIALQGTRQVDEITRRLRDAVDDDTWRDRRIRVGTPPDFQGDERNVVFLSMVVSDPGSISALTRAESQRRFNVAASRAMDQLWLFHSIDLDDLKPTDLRYSLLSYLRANTGPSIPPMPVDVPDDRRVAPFDSLFEQRIFNRLADRGYHVVPKMVVNKRTIDLVVTGADGRMAVECDGDRFTTTGPQARSEMERERELRRCGWEFWRVRESEFELDPDAALAGLWDALDRRGVKPDSVSATVSRENAPWEPIDIGAAE